MYFFILKKYYQVIVRSENAHISILVQLVLLFSFIYFSFFIRNASFFLLSLLSFSMISDSIKIKLGQNIDLANTIVLPYSKKVLFFSFLFRSIFSEKLILLFSYILIMSLAHQLHPKIIIFLILEYLIYCLIIINIEILSRRKGYVSVVFKNLSPLSILLVLPYFSNIINTTPNEYISILETFIIGLSLLHYILFICLLVFSSILSFLFFKRIFFKFPFYDSNIINNYNKNYWY